MGTREKRTRRIIFLHVIVSITCSILSAAKAEDTNHLLQNIARTIEAGYVKNAITYKPYLEKDLQIKADALIAALRKDNGAEKKDVLQVFGLRDVSSLGASIMIASYLQRPDIVDALQISKNSQRESMNAAEWNALDYASYMFFTRQTDSVEEIRNNLRILQKLLEAGYELSMAEHAKNTFRLPRLESYVDLAHEVVALKVLLENDLITTEEMQKRIQGTPTETFSLEPQFVKSLGANLKQYAPLETPLTIEVATDTIRSITTKKVQLYVIEKESAKGHGVETYNTALSTLLTLNPTADVTSVQAWSETLLFYTYSTNLSNALKILLNLKAPLQDQVVFSHSFGVETKQAQGEMFRSQNNEDSFDFQSGVYAATYLERSKPIIFTAAGNAFLEEGLFVASYGIIHSPRTLVVGAAAKYQAQKDPIVAPYTSNGADVCMTIPKQGTIFKEGSSFATPVLAAVYKQFSEWYDLSYEELIAAALLTASDQLLEFEDLHTANQISQNGEDFNPLQITSIKPIKTGGGLLHHKQCGAGLIQVAAWESALQWLVKQKVNNTNYSQFHKLQPVDATTYEIQIPVNLTTGRLTFFLPQNRKQQSDVTVTMPSGYQVKLGRTTTSILSTMAFAYEDIKVGDVIRIQSEKPLTEAAGIQLRGFQGENSIQKLRNFLRQNE